VALGGVGRADRASIATSYDKLRRADWRGDMSSWVAYSLATQLERLGRD